MPTVMHGHKKVAGKHCNNEDQQGNVSTYAQCRSKKYQQKGKSTSYDHPDNVFFHLLIFSYSVIYTIAGCTLALNFSANPERYFIALDIAYILSIIFIFIRFLSAFHSIQIYQPKSG